MESLHLAKNPFEQFLAWFKEAEARSDLHFPGAMALATVNSAGRPSVRMVLLKGVSELGFVFFTNFQSRKAEELGSNPAAALCFYWDELERQVRVEGQVEKISREDSEAYFRTRPRLSQLGAWASEQSREIPSRAHLEARVKKATEKFEGKEVPLPDFWGGYVLKPDLFEFWQLGQGRLHDRFTYTPAAGEWDLKRLAP